MVNSTKKKAYSMEDDPLRLLDAEQTAQLLNISRATLGRYVRENLMPEPVRLGGRLMWRQGELRQWIRDGCKVPQPALTA